MEVKQIILFNNSYPTTDAASETSRTQNTKAAADIIMIGEGGQNYRQKSRL